MNPRSNVGSVVVLISALVATTIQGCAQSANEEEAWRAFSAPDSRPIERVRTADAATAPEVGIVVPDRPRSKTPPVLILVHGGGWYSGSIDVLAPHARYFAALGWVCVSVSYRLTSTPGVTVMDGQQDVRSALTWVRRVASVRGWDGERICALGESAGGQLVCALGILPPEPDHWRVRALVLVNPVLDLTTLPWALQQPGLREAGPYNSADHEHHQAWKSSAMFHLTADTPRTLVVHGRNDVTVPFAQAEAFVARAKQVGAKVDLIVPENAAHAFL